MRVNFMIIGAQKAGTTSMAAQLADHPQICFSRVKEPGYFNSVTDWQANLDEYHKLFEPKLGQLLGEASTMYTFLPECLDTAERLFEYNPDLKLIYVMRQPVDRIVSLYAHNVVRNVTKLPPQEEIFANPPYINRSRYAVQIRPYLRLFERENIKLVVFEEYVRNQLETLKEIGTFLGIDPQPFEEADFSPKHKTVGEPQMRFAALRDAEFTDWFQTLRNVTPSFVRQPIRRRLLSKTIDEKPEFPAELKREVWRFVEDDVAAIESLLGRRLDVWRQGYEA